MKGEQIMRKMKMTGFGRTLAVLILAMGLAFSMLAGCSDEPASESSSTASESASSSTEASTTESASTEKGAPIVIGDSKAAGSLVVENGLGADITFVSVSAAGSQDEPFAMPIEGNTWKKGEKAKLYYGTPTAEVEYQVTVTANGMFYTLHNVKLGSMDEATLLADGGIAYLSYKSGGETLSTLDAEKALANAPAATEPAAEPEEVVYEEEIIYYDDDEDADDEDEDADDEDADEDEYTDDEETDEEDEYVDDEDLDYDDEYVDEETDEEEE